MKYSGIMKTIYKRYFFFLSLIIAIAIIFTTCKKDTECVAVITVKRLSDTLLVAPGATVNIHKSDVDVTGFADGSGQFRNTFKLEAILDVDATFYIPADTILGSPADTLWGNSIIRLVAGETVHKTVFVN